MTQYKDEIDTYIQEVLSQLQELPRDPKKASMGRDHYCFQVAHLVKEQDIAQAVSITPFHRLNDWIYAKVKPLTRKERSAMFGTIATVLVAITILFGGAGATVFAAQTSRPDEILYPLKTFSEDTQLLLTENPQRKLEMLMAYTDRRMAEIATMHSAGEPIQETVQARFQNELDQMLHIATGMKDPLMVQALEHIAIHVQKHEREIERLRVEQPDQIDPIMDQVREMLRLRVYLAELGINDPYAFRNQLQQMLRSGPGPLNQGENIMPYEGYGPGPASLDEENCLDCPNIDEGSEFGPGPSNNGELTHPEDGYGPQDPQGCNGCQHEGGSGVREHGPDSTNQGEKSPSGKLPEQNSDRNGNHFGDGSQQNRSQSNSNTHSGSSK